MRIKTGLLLVTPLLLPLSAESIDNESELENTDIINHITITSSLAERPLKDVSGNLHVINDEALAISEHEHINQIFVQVPGGWISRGNGQEHLTAIRSPVLTGAGGCGAFFIAQDGIPLRAPAFCNANQLFDANTEQAQSIEVLRGPASTLYGSNAVHGVINILTPNPLANTDSSISLVAGPHGYLGSDFSLGMQSDNHGLQVYGNAAHDGGYKEDSGFDQQKLNLIHQFEDQQFSVKSVIALTNLNQETAGFISGEEAYKDPNLKEQNPNPEAFRDAQSLRAHSQIKYSLDELSSVMITPYIRWNDMEFLQHYLPWQALENNSHQSFGTQFQYTKQFDQFNWQLGFDVDFTHGALTESQAEDFSPTIPAGTHYDYQVDTQSYSPFTRLEWTAGENTQISIGARFEQFEYDYNNQLSDGDACEVDVESCRFTRPTDQQISYQNFSYQLGVNHQLTTSQRLYAQFSTGHRSPQATELFRLQAGQTVADLDSEEMRAIEVGMRGQQDNLFYDASIFVMNKSNFIFQDSNRQNISDGETAHKGVEFALSYQLPNNFYGKVNGTYAKHQYDSSLTLSRTNIKNNLIDTAPKKMGSLQLGWKGESGNLIELEWVHLGKYFLNPENTAEYDGHDLFNLRVIAKVTDQLSANVRLLNIIDEDYAERADFGFGSYRYFVGEPRSIHASIHYRFN